MQLEASKSRHFSTPPLGQIEPNAAYLELLAELTALLPRLDLPLLPEVARRVVSATADDNCDARTLCEIIRRDASLAGRLLQVANSPLFACQSPTISLQQAVTRLGLRQVREVVLMISMQTRLFAVPAFEKELRAVFCHATATALFAQEIARGRRLNVEDAFLSGLFHDVGKPVILQAIVDRKNPVRMARESTLALVDELHLVGGAALARAWSLPPPLAHIIEHHHDQESSLPGILILRFADDLAHFALGATDAVASELLLHPAAEALNIYADEATRLIARAETIATAAAAL